MVFDHVFSCLAPVHEATLKGIKTYVTLDGHLLLQIGYSFEPLLLLATLIQSNPTLLCFQQYCPIESLTRIDSLKMSIHPIITFKAGICDLDVCIDRLCRRMHH